MRSLRTPPNVGRRGTVKTVRDPCGDKAGADNYTPKAGQRGAWPRNMKGGEMITVENDVRLYERNGMETQAVPSEYMCVRSHWNDDRWVVLEIDGETIAVSAADLRAAIVNATNSNRFG